MYFIWDFHYSMLYLLLWILFETQQEAEKNRFHQEESSEEGKACLLTTTLYMHKAEKLRNNRIT